LQKINFKEVDIVYEPIELDSKLNLPTEILEALFDFFEQSED